MTTKPNADQLCAAYEKELQRQDAEIDELCEELDSAAQGDPGVPLGGKFPPPHRGSPRVRKMLSAVSHSIDAQAADETAQKAALRNWLYNNHPQILGEFQNWWQAQKKK